MILITGGTGFLGQALIERLYNHPTQELRVLARNEGKLIELKQKFPGIEIYPGDVANYADVYQATKDVTGVYHLAAFKHVTEAERFPAECMRTNVTGSNNILSMSLERKFDFVLGISTDKAAQVAGVYGATKLLMERAFAQYERFVPRTKFRVVRYGNVLYSTGSVLCKWKDLLERGKAITISDPEATRFFWTRSEAIDLIFDCMMNAESSEPWIPEMKAMKLGDLANAMIDKYGDSRISYRVTGLQPGENKHEVLIIGGLTSNEVPQYSLDEIKERI